MKMRIIAGKHKSRHLLMVPAASTKETSDRIREAVFNILGGYIGGCVLDLFAGSGAYALEALSRGATHAYAVDDNKLAYQIITENGKTLHELEHMTIVNQDYKLFLKALHDDIRFDYIFLDPPYLFKGYLELLNLLVPFVDKGSKLILEVHKTTLLPDLHDHYKKQFERIYGIKKIVIYTR